MIIHYYTYLTDDEYALVIECLVKLKNSLLSVGKYTDGVDDVLLKFAKMKKKKVTIRQI